MAKEKPSEADAPEAQIQEPTPSEAPEETTQVETPEAQVEATPEGAEEAPAQEAEKPDLREQLGGLTPEERKSVYEEVFQEETVGLRQSAENSAWARIRGDQDRQMKANQGMQQTIKNLEGAEDDNQKMQHIQAYAQLVADTQGQQLAGDWMEAMREGLGVTSEQHEEIVWKLHQTAAREKRVASPRDYITQVVGDRYMPKDKVSKDISTLVQKEVEAQMAAARGERVEAQAAAAPVSMGSGESVPGLDAERYRKQTEEERAKTSAEEIDAMTAGYLNPP